MGKLISNFCGCKVLYLSIKILGTFFMKIINRVQHQKEKIQLLFNDINILSKQFAILVPI